jgi:hypothetical protein
LGVWANFGVVKKWATFLKINDMIIFLQTITIFLSEEFQFFSISLGENILKIIASL